MHDALQASVRYTGARMMGSIKSSNMMNTASIYRRWHGGPELATIAQIVSDDSRFRRLLAAATQADLMGVLSAQGLITLFAPNDEAFDGLPAATLDRLLADTIKLAQVLRYHIIPGRLMAGDVVEIEKAETMQGGLIRIRKERDAVLINDAQILIADVEASNGIVHVINSVLFP